MPDSPLSNNLFHTDNNSTQMKHITCLLFAMLSLGTANAQVAQWLVPPEYDDIEVLPESNVILAQQGFNHHIWDMNSKCLAKVSDDLYPFSEGYAVSTRPETVYVTAVYDTTGKKTDINDPKVQLGWGYPFFHDGFLLISDGNYFYFMDTEGGVEPKPYYHAYPFSHGYAACFTFAQLHKMKDPINLLLDTDMEPVELGYGGKRFAANDINFISSVSDEGIGIVVYKEKLYYFDAATAELSPVLPLSGDTNIKNQAHVDDDDIAKILVQVDENTKMMKGKCGKDRFSINFDAITLKPLSMTMGEEERVFEKKTTAQTGAPTTLKEVKDLVSGKYALYLGDKEVLPAQIDAVERLDGKVHVKLGLLRVNADDHFAFIINDKAKIGFRHKYFNTTIRLNMPAYINAEETSIEIDPQSGCDIDKRSKEARNNTDGSYVKYNCKLLCPQNISDAAMKVSYPAYIVYQGLRTPLTTVEGEAWHNKYFAVEVNQQDVELSGSKLTFKANITTNREPGEEIYPFHASLVSDQLKYEMHKIIDTQYECTVPELKRGTNIIVVRVEEEGCPPSDYAFEVKYEPPTPQKRHNVVVTKTNIIPNIKF